jgi:hypothetical protein
VIYNMGLSFRDSMLHFEERNGSVKESSPERAISFLRLMPG